VNVLRPLLSQALRFPSRVNVVGNDYGRRPQTNPAANPLSEKSTMNEDVFSLSEEVTIKWPTPLSADSIQDLKDSLKILECKIARSAAAPETPSTG
jgi:hypothetical protein